MWQDTNYVTRGGADSQMKVVVMLIVSEIMAFGTI